MKTTETKSTKADMEDTLKRETKLKDELTKTSKKIQEEKERYQRKKEKHKKTIKEA
jgi:hypothetical protein